MSDLPKWIIGIILWLLLTIGSYNYSKTCICASLPFCKHEHVLAVPSTSSETKRAPLDFRWSDATTFTNEGFVEFKSTILHKKNENNILEITGYYIEGEQNSSTFSNMGLARANKIKKLFVDDLGETRIRLKSKKFPFSLDKKQGFFEGASFDWIPVESRSVEIFSDRTIIRFPFNSVQKEIDPTIDNYLEKLANRIVQSKEKISITGHTDNVGEQEINLQIAHRRAKMIRDILLQKGVKRNQLYTDSKGENEPISTNETEEGRKNNRRVVVKLLPPKPN